MLKSAPFTCQHKKHFLVLLIVKEIDGAEEMSVPKELNTAIIASIKAQFSLFVMSSLELFVYFWTLVRSIIPILFKIANCYYLLNLTN